MTRSTAGVVLVVICILTAVALLAILVYGAITGAGHEDDDHPRGS